jgi:type IV pilus assembly protein PilE
MVRRHSSGFTLIEIMVAVALVAILASIAIPSYSAYVVRGQRAAAKASLVQAAQFLERNYTTYGCYYGTLAECQAGAGALALPVGLTNAPTDGGRISYAITVAAAAGPPPGQGFVLTATPCGAVTCPAGSNTGFADPDCGALLLDNTGTKTATGTIGTTKPELCWGR